MVTRGEGKDTIHIELSVRRSTLRRALAVTGSLAFFAGMGAAMAVPSSAATERRRQSEREPRGIAVAAARWHAQRNPTYMPDSHTDAGHDWLHREESSRNAT